MKEEVTEQLNRIRSLALEYKADWHVIMNAVNKIYSIVNFNSPNPFESLDKLAQDILAEALAAEGKFGKFASLHEAYAVLWEEVHELFDQVRKKQFPPESIEGPVMGTFEIYRSATQIKNEAIQIAAVAYRIALDADRLARK